MIREFLAGMTLGGVAAIVALQYHLVRTDDGLIVIPRTHQPPLRSAYVDTRSWSLDTWKNYPEVTEAVVLSGRSNLITDRSQRIIQEQPATTLGPIGNSAVERSRSAMNSLLNVRSVRPADDLELNQLMLDPPPSRRLPDTKPGISPPMAALDREQRSAARPEPIREPASEDRLVPAPAGMIPDSPPANPKPEQPEVRPQESVHWLKGIFDKVIPQNPAGDNQALSPDVPLSEKRLLPDIASNLPEAFQFQGKVDEVRIPDPIPPAEPIPPIQPPAPLPQPELDPAAGEYLDVFSLPLVPLDPGPPPPRMLPQLN